MAIKSLQELAIAKAIQERSWLKNDFIFKTFPRDVKSMFIQCCMEAKNIIAFEELILKWKQQDLIIRDNADFTSEFALVVYNLISNKNSHWKETGINIIDFSGCDIGRYFLSFILLTLSLSSKKFPLHFIRSSRALALCE